MDHSKLDVSRTKTLAILDDRGSENTEASGITPITQILEKYRFGTK